MARKKLGEMLIEAGVLDEARLRSALADQRRWGRSLGKTLVELRLIAEEDLVAVLGRHLGLPSIDLDKFEIPDSVTRMIPDELARQHQILAFDQQMKFLDVAMVDPTNIGVTDELRIRTQMNIRPYLCGPRNMERALAKYHGGTHRAESGIPFDGADMVELEPAPPVERMRRPTTPAASAPAPQPGQHDGLRQYPARTAPPMLSGGQLRDAEIDALQARLQQLEALVARDEEVLRKLLALLIEKGVASREEILERLS
jgi:type II secretion system (T2SS) protein E